METTEKSEYLMQLLEEVGREVMETTPLVNNDLFTPVISQQGTPDSYVNGNELIRPPYHVELLFECEDKRYLYDSCGFTEITEDNGILIAENVKEFERRKHTHVKVTWESLLKITQDPFGWNDEFHRNTDSFYLVEIVYQKVSRSKIAPDLIAVQNFMSAFRV